MELSALHDSSYQIKSLPHPEKTCKFVPFSAFVLMFIIIVIISNIIIIIIVPLAGVYMYIIELKLKLQRTSPVVCGYTKTHNIVVVGVASLFRNLTFW